MKTKQDNPIRSFKYNCGCGFRSTRVVTAIEHVVVTSHTVTIAGLIYPMLNKGGEKVSVPLPQNKESLTETVQ